MIKNVSVSGSGSTGSDDTTPKTTRKSSSSSEKLLSSESENDSKAETKTKTEMTMSNARASADAEAEATDVCFCPMILKSLGILLLALAVSVILLWFHFHVRLSVIERLQFEQSKNSADCDLARARFLEEFAFQELNLPDAEIGRSDNFDLDENQNSFRGKRIKRKVEQNIRSGKSKQQQSTSTPENRKSDDFNPRLREEKEESTNAVPIGPDGAWLTAYSRIPVAEMHEFCGRVKDYCPEGPPGTNGMPGKPGSKGDRGDTGSPGERGNPGPQGPTGFRGPKGEHGLRGIPGMDGADGSPGEPGLDGRPGYFGKDGDPGRDGKDGKEGSPGKAGIDGIPGRNGTDGNPGQQGEPGPSGERGPPGLTGFTGQKGEAGTPGQNGVQAYAFQNGTNHEILVPPAIIGSAGKMRALVVNEGDNVRLRCTATGTPPPIVSWEREDKGIIQIGTWKGNSIEGPVVNFTGINRQHMGEYICMAENGLAPSAERSYKIEVNFSPFIRVQNPQVSVVLESTATLQCMVEAFPEAVTYWESSDENFLTSGDKYQIISNYSESYKILMTLNITKVSKSDFSFYYCVSKNRLGLVKGRLRLSELDPKQAPPSSHSIVPYETGDTYGKQPPKFEDIRDICPPMPPPCKECPARIESKCTKGGYYLLDKLLWEIGKLGRFSLPTAADRSPLKECVVSAVGKPVYHGTRPFEGTWMRESFVDSNSEKYWLTSARDGDSMNLQEFDDQTSFGENKSSRNHSLFRGFKGNYHTIYNGSFYYIAKPESTAAADPAADEGLTIFRQSLSNQGNTAQYKLPHSSFAADTLYSPYSSRMAKSWADLAVDENGLWAIYSLEGSNNTAVVKIDLDENENMNVTFGWNITISHKLAGDMFIICGVLYAVDSVTEQLTKIRMALDLYNHGLIKVELPFTNPFVSTIMISYNPKTKELFTWDGGNQLIYPVKRTPTGPDVSTSEFSGSSKGRHTITTQKQEQQSSGGQELNHGVIGYRKQSKNGAKS